MTVDYDSLVERLEKLHDWVLTYDFDMKAPDDIADLMDVKTAIETLHAELVKTKAMLGEARRVAKSALTYLLDAAEKRKYNPSAPLMLVADKPSELLSCPNPWCDRPNNLRVSVCCNRWRVCCPCNICGPVSTSLDAAIAAWNTRATPSDHQPTPVAPSGETPKDWMAKKLRDIAPFFAENSHERMVAEISADLLAATLHKLAIAREALERIVSCESRAKGDVVDVARQALTQIGK
jgi:hypothetical protein